MVGAVVGQRDAPAASRLHCDNASMLLASPVLDGEGEGLGQLVLKDLIWLRK